MILESRRAEQRRQAAAGHREFIDQWTRKQTELSQPPVEFKIEDVSDCIRASMDNGRHSGTDTLSNVYMVPPLAGAKELPDVTNPDFWQSHAPKASP
jgi:hypothetical protein